MEVPSDDGISYYSQVAADFHASYNSDPNRLERMQVWGSFLDRYTAGVTFAYDIGCGSGVLACELAGRGIETVGIDGASGMLAIAERTSRMRTDPPSVRNTTAPACETRFSGHSS